MKLSTQIQQIQKNLHNNQSAFEGLKKQLQAANRNHGAPSSNPVGQLVAEINRNLNRSGIFPLKFNATPFTQGHKGGDRYLELSWQRNDLMLHKGFKVLKVPISHGPGFRITIFGDGTVRLGFNHRYMSEADDNFRKNILSDNGYLELSFGRIIKKYSFELKWYESYESNFFPETFSELREYVKENHAKATRDSLWITKAVKISTTTNPERFAKIVTKSFIELCPFFYSMLFNLQPKNSKTHSSMKGQITKEQLRKNLLKIEKDCQNEACRVPKSHQTLQMAHLKPGIHQLSNVIALCSACHDLQRPRDSTIEIGRKISGKKGAEIYIATVSTLKGDQKWRIRSKHPLKKF